MNIKINGKILANRDCIKVFDPAAQTLIDTVPAMTPEDVHAAVQAAKSGGARWAKVPQYDRSRVLRKFISLVEENAAELTKLYSRENGKLHTEAQGEFGALSLLTNGYCERANHLYGTVMPDGSSSAGGLHDIAFTRREPLGVFACILPFNFTIAMFGHKVIPALAVGNSVVIKPPSDCPLTTVHLSEYLVAAGVSEGAVQVITGHGASVGDALVSDPDVNAVSITSSTSAGINVYRKASAHLARVFMELGANDAFIMFEDAAVELAVQEALASRLLNAGQICCGSKRFIVHKSIAAEFTAQLIEALKSVKTGSQFDAEATMGCLISDDAAIKVESQVRHTISQGAKCVYGGTRSGAFYQPTVLVNVTSEMDIAHDMEVFGPVFPIITFEHESDAIALANDCSFGLSGAVFSRDTAKAVSAAAALHSGSVVINGGNDYRTIELPFGGYKQSGIGREGISRTLEEMTQEKNYILKGILSKRS